MQVQPKCSRRGAQSSGGGEDRVQFDGAAAGLKLASAARDGGERQPAFAPVERAHVLFVLV